MTLNERMERPTFAFIFYSYFKDESLQSLQETKYFNVLRLCEGGEIEAQMFNLAQMFNRIPNVQNSTKTPLLQNRC